MYIGLITCLFHREMMRCFNNLLMCCLTYICYGLVVISLFIAVLFLSAETPKVTCFPNPCGPHSKCRELNNRPTCSCLPSFLGAPPDCRPECTVNSDCPGHMACIGQKCTRVCDDICGENADCRAHRHVATCTCRPGHTGDAYSYCSPIPRK